MTLRQHCLGRRSLTLTIEGDVLHVLSATWFSRHSYRVLLAEISLKFDEWSHVAIGWYLVAVACLAFLGFHFRDGWYADSFGLLVGLIYFALAAYSGYWAWRRSGSFVVVRVEGKYPRSVNVFRQRPSRDAVDRFLAELTTAVQKAKAAATSSTPVPA